MPTILKAGNASDGYSMTPGGDGELVIKTGAGAGTDAITIDASQNIAFTGELAVPDGISGTFKMDSGYGSVAPVYGCRAWANIDGVTADDLSGTYSQSGTTVTVTATAHGLIAGNVIYSDITSGTGVDGQYTVDSVTNANTFTYIAGTSLTTSGGITLKRMTIRDSGNISSVTYLGSTGRYVVNFAVAMPDANYAPVVSGVQSTGTGTTAAQYMVGVNTNVAPTVYAVEIYSKFCRPDQSGFADIEYLNLAVFR
jgi:hypothetical protein